MRGKYVFSVVLFSVLLMVIANSYVVVKAVPWILVILLPLFLAINVLGAVGAIEIKSKGIRNCYRGVSLLTIFLIVATASFVWHVVLIKGNLYAGSVNWVWSAIICVCVEAVIFWNGIIRVYLTSIQLGIKQRIIGIIFGMVPVANLIALFGIIRTVKKEVLFEIEKEKVNEERKNRQICFTKYPVLLVHGVFFRDSRYFNYWGRVPKELEKNGAKIYYGNHQSALSVADSGQELAKRIKEIVSETGCEKVNIIAHSKGGLDCRYAVSCLDAAPYVASITTINTPHRGCQFADYLLTKIPLSAKEKIARTYNSTLKKLGDTNPDFLAAVEDLTASTCRKSDKMMKDAAGILCRSVGSIMEKADRGKFPLNFSYQLVKFFDGKNDGLVSEDSFQWGEEYILLTTKKKRGISHGDVIDLNRENLPDFDVREFYVSLVEDLKNRGL